MDKAQPLESKLKVAMAKVPSFGGEGDANDQEAIDQISRTGGIAVA
jgi:hypothetical protein